MRYASVLQNLRSNNRDVNNFRSGGCLLPQIINTPAPHSNINIAANNINRRRVSSAP